MCHTQRFHILKWIHTRREDKKYRRGRSALFEGFCKLCLPTLCILNTKLFLNKIPTTCRQYQQTEKRYQLWKGFGVKLNVLLPQGIGHAVRAQGSHND